MRRRVSCAVKIFAPTDDGVDPRAPESSVSSSCSHFWLVVVGTTNIRLQLVRGRTSVIVLMQNLVGALEIYRLYAPRVLLHNVVVENVGRTKLMY